MECNKNELVYCENHEVLIMDQHNEKYGNHHSSNYWVLILWIFSSTYSVFDVVMYFYFSIDNMRNATNIEMECAIRGLQYADQIIHWNHFHLQSWLYLVALSSNIFWNNKLKWTKWKLTKNLFKLNKRMIKNCLLCTLYRCKYPLLYLNKFFRWILRL